MKTIRLISFFIILISSFVFFTTASSLAKVTVSLESGPEEIDSFSTDGVDYISLSGLADILDSRVDWVTVGHTARFINKENQIDFLIGSPYLKIHDSTFNVTYPVELKDGQLFIPAITALSFVDKVTTERVSWDSRSKSVRVESNYFNVTDISFSPRTNGLLVEILLTKPLTYDVFVSTGNWVNISIRDGFVNAAKIESRIDRRILYNLKTHQEEGVAQVSFQLRMDIKTTYNKLLNNPNRIQISIPDVNFTMDSLTSAPAPQGKFDGKIDVIAIDPGHGGEDFGAIGYSKTREKDITLVISRKLADLIREDGRFKVVMTRNSDKTLTLQDRADVANKGGADLFISIHANANRSTKARGWNVFFLAPAKNDSARAVEQFENSHFIKELTGKDAETSKETGPSDENPVLGILNEMLMTEFQTESHDLALAINNEFKRNLSIPSRGVDQAGFFVLNKVFTPSVLVETAFITNKTDAKLLKDGKFQDKVAVSIYNAIKQFTEKYDKR